MESRLPGPFSRAAREPRSRGLQTGLGGARVESLRVRRAQGGMGVRAGYPGPGPVVACGLWLAAFASRPQGHGKRASPILREKEKPPARGWGLATIVPAILVPRLGSRERSKAALALKTRRKRGKAPYQAWEGNHSRQFERRPGAWDA